MVGEPHAEPIFDVGIEIVRRFDVFLILREGEDSFKNALTAHSVNLGTISLLKRLPFDGEGMLGLDFGLV